MLQSKGNRTANASGYAAGAASADTLQTGQPVSFVPFVSCASIGCTGGDGVVQIDSGYHIMSKLEPVFMKLYSFVMRPTIFHLTSYYVFIKECG